MNRLGLSMPAAAKQIALTPANNTHDRYYIHMALGTLTHGDADRPRTINYAVEPAVNRRPWVAWLYSHFDAVRVNGDPAAADVADPNANGLPNLVEYALDALPCQSDANDSAPLLL